MARTRALLTEKDREHLASTDTEAGSRRYQVVSEVRNRIRDELTKDVQVLAEHHPELLDELRAVVCHIEDDHFSGAGPAEGLAMNSSAEDMMEDDNE